MIATVLLLALATAVGWWAWEKSHRKTRQVPAGHQPDVRLPYEDEFELYHNARSWCSKKARVTRGLARLRAAKAANPALRAALEGR